MQKITEITSDPTINLAIDTVKIKKQALIFANTKRSAEKTAEDISKKMDLAKNPTGHGSKAELSILADKILKTLSRPTKQCERLSNCVKKGVAFHHAGLTQKQKDLIQDNFSKGLIRIIAATPTLAAGVDLPAFRAIIKDLRRFSGRGLSYIPVLEYKQMAGRAGRPNFDTSGEAILIAKTDTEKDKLAEQYIYGLPEKIYSKLAVEPVLRFYLLSLIAGNFVRTKRQILAFFEKTFWAHQYDDMSQLEAIIDRMLDLLEGFDFLRSTKKESDFMNADEIGKEEKYNATNIGKRVAELYIDPLTAHNMIQSMKRAEINNPDVFGYLHMISYTNELKPALRVKVKEYEHYQELYATNEDDILAQQPTPFDYEYDDFMNSIKTASFFKDWIEENDEEMLLEKYDIRPGEIRYKLDVADWLVYSCIELAKLLEMKDIYRQLNVLRVRLKNGAREELLALLRLKNIGRVRARKLYKNSIKDIKDIKKSDIGKLKQILGEKTALSLKEQVGGKVEEVPKSRRKGQMSIEKY